MNGIRYSADTTLNLASQDPVRPLLVKSVFSGHALRPERTGSTGNRQFQPDWILLVLLSGFILLAWTNFFSFNRLKQMILAPFSKRFLSQLTREGTLFTERISLALGSVYLLSFSLLLYLVNAMLLHLSFRNLSGLPVYLIILASLLLFWSLKIWLIRFLGSVFRTPSTTFHYQVNLLVFTSLEGLITLPLLVGVVYLKSPTLLAVTLGISMLIFLFRFMKGFFIGLGLTKFSYLFLFVYLCSLEILPLLILIKLVLLASRT
jgi:hypothetical protein